MKTRQIGIIGAGASGLMAAVSAAWTGEIAAQDIVLLEQQDRKKTFGDRKRKV